MQMQIITIKKSNKTHFYVFTYNDESWYFTINTYKKASIRWQDSARRQFQAGLEAT